MEVVTTEDAREVLGINNRVELAEVDRLFRERKATELMLAGVTIERPETVTIDVDVEIGMDTVVEPFTRILGKTKIGEGCRIGAGAIIQDSRLADQAEVRPYTVVVNSRLGRKVQVGPFARLRTDNDLEDGVYIGNFVELKKARLGPGTKASHLTYLGDAELGGKVNVGAGTITCNYYVQL
jgi:bifunctional UDP-N-acetylglucosamine pyrophosphorylase/glucosamine-1-phosphate N-acetyltransferase